VVEGARLESGYTARYRGFESLPLCGRKKPHLGAFFMPIAQPDFAEMGKTTVCDSVHTYFLQNIH
jgi:hypothetical protein